jgi:pilus assembly protein CpaB
MAAKPRAVFIIGIVAVAIAAIASISLYTYLKGEEAKMREAVATEKIVVAAEEIPGGETIKVNQAKTTNWPKANLPQGSFSSPDQAAGRITLERYLPGDPIVGGKLAPKEGQSGVLTYKIPQGHRAITVSVDQVAGVAGFITPGNKVDVVLTTTPPGASQPISKIVRQNIPILAIGQIIDQKEGKPVVVPTVTMDVTPEDSEALAIASTQGKLQLVLRRAGDADVAKTIGATISRVMGTAGVAEMKASPKGKFAKKPPLKEGQKEVMAEKIEKPRVINVEVWRGAAKSIETLSIENSMENKER